MGQNLHATQAPPQALQTRAGNAHCLPPGIQEQVGGANKGALLGEAHRTISAQLDLQYFHERLAPAESQG